MKTSFDRHSVWLAPLVLLLGSVALSVEQSGSEHLSGHALSPGSLLRVLVLTVGERQATPAVAAQSSEVGLHAAKANADQNAAAADLVPISRPDSASTESVVEPRRSAPSAPQTPISFWRLLPGNVL